jgi:uncharacterized phage protein gp47/JayE
MSEIIFPENVKVVADRMRTDVQYNLPDSSPFIENNSINAVTTAAAGRNFDCYRQMTEILKQMFLDTATGDYLIRWGSYKNITPNPATQASGNIVFTGTAGSIIPVGAVLTSDDDNQYTVQTQITLAAQIIGASSVTRSGNLVTVTTSNPHNLATNMLITIAGAVETDYNGAFTITVTADDEFTYNITTTPTSPATGTITANYTGNYTDVLSIDFGISANQSSGVELSLSSPISGVNNTAYVTYDELAGGTDAEDTTSKNSAYRKRVLFSYQQPHALFNKNEIITTAKTVSGVTRVWVEEATPEAGMVTVYFVRDNDASIIPTATEVTAVKNAILTIKQAVTRDVDVLLPALTPVTVDFVFTALSPNTSAMQAAITANLQAVFREANNASEDMIEDTYHCAIFQTIDATGTQVQSFTLTSPVGDISVGSGEIAILGTITYP